MRFQKFYDKTLHTFTERVLKELDGNIESIIVFGSVARKEARKDSDIDILIISDKGEKIKDKVLDISYDIDLENKTVTTRVYLTPNEVRRMIKLGSPFIEDVIAQGVVLYDNGTFKRLRAEVLGIGK